jgi:xanthine dehydrogenase accessory factor
VLNISGELREWCEEDRDFAVATLVSVTGSAPRQPGAALAVDSGGTAVGSISGGCVEGELYERCREVLDTGEPVLARFGPDADDPFLAQLTCGGLIEVLVAPVRAGTRRTVAGALGDASAALVRVVDGPPGLLGRPLLVRPDGSCEGSLGGTQDLDTAAAAEARAVLAAGRGWARVQVGADGGRCGEPVTLFIEANVPPPRMLVFGAIDVAGALAHVGRFLGYRVTVCDARPVFATAERFPDAHEVVVDWPDRFLRATPVDSRTVVCVLSHDPKFDIPLLTQALALPVAYVGALGSRRTHADRLLRLRAEGVGEQQLARLHGPVGLDLGARSPEETALSIAAEIVAARYGGTGRPLTGSSLPLHRDSGRTDGSRPAGTATARIGPIHSGAGSPNAKMISWT